MIYPPPYLEEWSEKELKNMRECKHPFDKLFIYMGDVRCRLCNAWLTLQDVYDMGKATK